LFWIIALLGVTSAGVAGEEPDPISDPGHFDAIVSFSPPATSGARIEVDKAGIFPRDFATKRVVIPANFGDFAGGPYKTDDPGWVVVAGGMLPGETLRYRALGRLQFWDNAAQRWTGDVPRGETVRLFGEVPSEALLRNDPAELARYQQGTIWTTSGVTGPMEAAIQAADSGGDVHAHLDFCVQDQDGDCARHGLGHSGSPTAGAYLVELQIFVATLTQDGRPKYRPSNPIYILLNRGLIPADFQRAVSARTTASSTIPSEQLPAAGILILGR
jgi:hypothetical protein